MWYVYIIRSAVFPKQEYTGVTADLKQRMADHNAGKSTHTAKFAPWELVCYVGLSDKTKAYTLCLVDFGTQTIVHLFQVLVKRSQRALAVANRYRGRFR
jgi:hypothetical protein